MENPVKMKMSVWQKVLGSVEQLKSVWIYVVVTGATVPR